MKAYLDQISSFDIKTIVLIAGIGGGLILAGSQGVRLVQEWQVRRQEQALLTQIQALEASQDYSQCRTQGATVVPTTEIYGAVRDVVQSCFLKDAQQQANQGEWVVALEILVDFPTQGDRYAEAQTLMQEGMAALVAEAETVLATGDLETALAITGSIPAAMPGIEAIEQMKTDWQTAWSQNAELKASAEQSLQRGRWLEAKQTLDQVTNHPYWQQEIEPLMTRAQAGIDRVMARERAARRAEMQRQQESAFQQRLQSVYNTYISEGMEELEAWSTACRTLGGSVVDRGPESICQS